MSDLHGQIITTVSRYPCIYDSCHEDYKNFLKKAEAWNEVAVEHNLTIEEAKLKWKHLRDSYVRYRKSLSKKNPEAEKYGKWPWRKEMAFLDKALTPRNLRTSVISTFGNEESSIPYYSPVDEDNSGPPRKKRKPLQHIVKKSASDSEDDTDVLGMGVMPEECTIIPEVNILPEVSKVISLAESNTQPEKELDGIDHLFLSYAATFKNFQPRSQIKLKLKLATIFSEVELEELEVS